MDRIEVLDQLCESQDCILERANVAGRLAAFGFTGYRVPWYSLTIRFLRISYPILPRWREAPMTVMDFGEKIRSGPSPAISRTNLPRGTECSWDCSPACIITHGNGALSLIYREEKPE